MPTQGTSKTISGSHGEAAEAIHKLPDSDRPSSWMRRAMSSVPHSFDDPRLLELALTHKSHAHEAGQSRLHNESLEFLGDSILGFLITDR